MWSRGQVVTEEHLILIWTPKNQTTNGKSLLFDHLTT